MASQGLRKELKDCPVIDDTILDFGGEFSNDLAEIHPLSKLSGVQGNVES